MNPATNVLRVAGAFVGSVTDAQRLCPGYNGEIDKLIRHMRRGFCWLGGDGNLETPYVGGGSFAEAYVTTLCDASIREKFVPELEHLPAMDECVQALATFVSWSDERIETEAASESFRTGPGPGFLTYVGGLTTERQLFKLSTGHIGNCADDMRPGDEGVRSPRLRCAHRAPPERKRCRSVCSRRFLLCLWLGGRAGRSGAFCRFHPARTGRKIRRHGEAKLGLP